MFQQSHLVAAFAFRRKQHGVADTEISNATVSQFIKIIGGFFSGKGIVVVNVDGLVGGLHCFADNDMKQTLISQIGCYWTVFFRIEQDKAIFLGIGYHALYRIQHFCIILPGDDRIHIASLVAELPDAADDLQMECVFIDITLRRGQDNADRLGKCLYRFCLKIGYIAQLCHNAAYPFLGFPADGRAVLAGA